MSDDNGAKISIQEAKTNGGWRGLLKSAWKAVLHNVQAWFWKLMFTLISTKVLVTVGTIWVLYHLMTTNHVVQQVVGEGIVSLTVPYLPGEAGGGFIRDVAIALIGARVFGAVMSMGGEVYNRMTNGNSVEPESGPDDGEEEYHD